jgi:AAA family ATP:ADP antiporter
MLFHTVVATFLYFQQAEIVEAYFETRTERTQVFAQIDLIVNILTVLAQVFLTARIVRALGLAVTLTLLPLLAVLGFGSLGLFPTIGVLIVFQTLRRSGNFAIARPAREVLYTVLKREDKYKAKTLIDTFVYRAGDQVGAWGYAGLTALGLAFSGISFAAVPLAAAWGAVGYWLGRTQKRIASAGGGQPAG